MESQENLQLERYYFEKELFSKDMNRIWHYFYRSDKGLRDTYIFIRIIHQEECGEDFQKSFRCSVNTICYRSLLRQSQTKKYIRVLIELGLVERNIKKEISKTDPRSNKSEAFYKVKKITPEVIQELQISRIFAVLESEKHIILKECGE